MKARVLITLAISLFLSVGLYAQKGNIVVYSNMSVEKGTKEYITFDKGRKQAVSKITYFSDENGNKIERVFYVWNIEKGWVAMQKHEYMYDDDSALASIVYTKWDKKANDWSASSEHIDPLYNSGDKHLAANDK